MRHVRKRHLIAVNAVCLMLFLLMKGKMVRPVVWSCLLKAPAQPQINFSETRVEPGGFFVITVQPLEKNQEVRVVGGVLTEPPFFTPYKQGVRALVPITYRTLAGTHQVEVRVMQKDRVMQRMTQSIIVTPREFAVQKMYVSEELLARRDEALWAKDGEIITESTADPHVDAMWEGPFLLPVKGRQSTDFGQIRMINDKQGGRHSGLDLVAPIGTPILAANHGIVVLARALHVTGNTVILDHGASLTSSYSHLAEIVVEVGQEVRKGQVIGMVGNTGFSTAPHLHWAISIGSTFVDPELFLSGDYLKSMGE